ncbi:hypothetical protein [Nocardia sp. NPDC052566]|uniref:hypothetical protein n=1 Tax=Nocardia sp. NPDC052566 TaxID=3364330 RepID=UPI0037CBB8AF
MQNLVIRALPGIGALFAVAAFAAPTHAAPAANAQQAQDACIGYLLQTIRAMPEGTYLEFQPDPDRPTPPGHTVPTGTGSFLLPRDEYYVISYRLLGDSGSAAYTDAESAWEDLGWPTNRKPPLSNGAQQTNTHPTADYTLDALFVVGPTGSRVTLSCTTASTFPGGGPGSVPAPTTLTR